MHCNGLYAALLCVFERSDYLPGFPFEDVHKSMVASPYNSLTSICESHPLGICLNGFPGDERAYKLTRIDLVYVKSICYVINNTKSLFCVDASMSATSRSAPSHV